MLDVKVLVDLPEEGVESPPLLSTVPSLLFAEAPRDLREDSGGLKEALGFEVLGVEVSERGGTKSSPEFGASSLVEKDLGETAFEGEVEGIEIEGLE